MKTAGIILAAGRGSRMGNLTRNKPKCLVSLGGRTLLEWQIMGMEKCKVERLLVVRGYRSDDLAGPFETVDNFNWENSNMLSSLLCASQYVESCFNDGIDRIGVSYSDIVWSFKHLKKLFEVSGDLAITYDVNWLPLWQLRFGDPLLDAETFSQQGGLLKDIGEKPDSLLQVEGQYMGLMSFNKPGWLIISDACARLGEQLPRTDMTAFLRILLRQRQPVGCVPVTGAWCEVDSERDLRVYQSALEAGNWDHDWRNDYEA